MLFFALALALGLSAIGWFQAALGWLCATVLIAAQILGDVINAASGKAAEGLTIAGALLVYPLRSTVRGAFSSVRRLADDSPNNSTSH